MASQVGHPLDPQIVSQMFEAGKRIYEEKSQTKVDRRSQAFDLLYSCAKNNHPEAMYLSFKVTMTVPALKQDPNALLEAYSFLGQAADMGWPAALKKIDQIKPQHDNQELAKRIEGVLAYYKGKLAEKKASECYRNAMEYQYQPGESTPLFQALLSDPNPKKRRRISAEEDESEGNTRTSHSTNYLNPEAKQPDIMHVDVSSVLNTEKREIPSTTAAEYYLNKGQEHLDHYQKTKDSNQLDLATQAFSQGWTLFGSRECLNKWGIVLLESDIQEYREQGIEYREQAANFIPCIWIDIGLIYDRGEKISKNDTKARECYLKGLEMGDSVNYSPTPLFTQLEKEYKEASLSKVQVCLRNENYNNALSIVQRLSWRGDLKAKCIWAKMLINGWCCSQDVSCATRLLTEVITSEGLQEPSEMLGEAQYLLGFIYLGNEKLHITSLDENAALEFFEKAAENNRHPLAAYEAGCLYEKKQDHAKAHKFFEIGRQLQDPRSIEKCNALNPH